MSAPAAYPPEWQAAMNTLIMGGAAGDGEVDFGIKNAADKALFEQVLWGLELAAQLWPKPRHATVTIETHTWERLRKVLLALPELWIRGER